MNLSELEGYCLSKSGAYKDYPFGAYPICYRLCGKIFAQLYPPEYGSKITLKCSREEGDFFKAAFPKAVVSGYHCPPVQKPYWVTVYLDEISDEALLHMIDTAYLRVLQGLPKSIRKMNNL